MKARGEQNSRRVLKLNPNASELVQERAGPTGNKLMSIFQILYILRHLVLGPLCMTETLTQALPPLSIRTASKDCLPSLPPCRPTRWLNLTHGSTTPLLEIVATPKQEKDRDQRDLSLVDVGVVKMLANRAGEGGLKKLWRSVECEEWGNFYIKLKERTFSKEEKRRTSLEFEAAVRACKVSRSLNFNEELQVALKTPTALAVPSLLNHIDGCLLVLFITQGNILRTLIERYGWQIRTHETMELFLGFFTETANLAHKVSWALDETAVVGRKAVDLISAIRTGIQIGEMAKEYFHCVSKLAGMWFKISSHLGGVLQVLEVITPELQAVLEDEQHERKEHPLLLQLHSASQVLSVLADTLHQIWYHETPDKSWDSLPRDLVSLSRFQATWEPMKNEIAQERGAKVRTEFLSLVDLLVKERVFGWDESRSYRQNLGLPPEWKKEWSLSEEVQEEESNAEKDPGLERPEGYESAKATPTPRASNSLASDRLQAQQVANATQNKEEAYKKILEAQEAYYRQFPEEHQHNQLLVDPPVIPSPRMQQLEGVRSPRHMTMSPKTAAYMSPNAPMSPGRVAAAAAAAIGSSNGVKSSPRPT
ncbi:hypothetical protein T439DRAFT_349691 [Meredithblackwellia eburnea MCA 4105]